VTEGGAFCAKCGASNDVGWCPAWGEYLCGSHRHERTYKELDATQRPDRWLEVQARDVAVMTL
jgi:hypothetical protein